LAIGRWDYLREDSSHRGSHVETPTLTIGRWDYLVKRGFLTLQGESCGDSNP
jgi:hypothetical protein